MKKNRGGFTLVEVIVVLVILAILAAILVPSMVGWIDEANAKTCTVNRGFIARQYAAYKALHYTDGKAVDIDTFIKTCMDGSFTEVNISGDIQKAKCPSGGTYSGGERGTYIIIKCSVHGDEFEYDTGTNGVSFDWAAGELSQAIIANKDELNKLKKYNYQIYHVDDMASGELKSFWDSISDDLKSKLAGRAWTIKKENGSYATGYLYIYDGDISKMGAEKRVHVRKYSIRDGTYKNVYLYTGTKDKKIILSVASES